jgi:hypothetical protein
VLTTTPLWLVDLHNPTALQIGLSLYEFGSWILIRITSVLIPHEIYTFTLHKTQDIGRVYIPQDIGRVYMDVGDQKLISRSSVGLARRPPVPPPGDTSRSLAAALAAAGAI